MLRTMAELLFLPHYAEVLQSVVHQALEQGVIDVECRDDLDPGVVAGQVRAFAARTGHRLACKPHRGRVEVRATGRPAGPDLPTTDLPTNGGHRHPAGRGAAQGA
jgi:hypothetical protein